MVLPLQQRQEVSLEGQITRQEMLSREHQGPRAVLNAVERLAGGHAIEASRLRQDVGIAEGQLRDYQARLGQPFPLERYLAELAALRDQFRVGLSGATQQEEPVPEAGEVAARIKELRAGNVVEASAERVVKRVAGEEPVTARIMRKAEDGWRGRIEGEAKRASGRGG